MTDPSAETLLDRLAKVFPTAKRQSLRRMISAGRVRVNGVRAARATQRLVAGDRVEVSRRQADASPRKDAGRLLAPLKVIFEDQDLLVVDKPQGLLTSTVPREKRPTALALVRRYVAATQPAARVGLIHRLDRDASGLLVFSKTHAAYDSLKTQFFKHTVERIYHAIVRGKPNPPAGRIESFLIERADGTVHTTTQHAKGQHAITHYDLIEHKGGRSLLRVRLETGRKHQIRVHLSERGCPIVGDSVYGEDADDSPELMLAAVELALDHPRTGRRLTLKLDRPLAEPL